MLTFGINETHYWDSKVNLLTGDSVIFEINGNKYESEPSKKSGVLDMYRSRMLAELYKINGFSLVFM